MYPLTWRQTKAVLHKTSSAFLLWTMVQDHILMYINQSIFNRYKNHADVSVSSVPLLHEEALLSVCMSVRARQSGPVNCTSLCWCMFSTSVLKQGEGGDRSCFRLCSYLDISVHFSIWAIYAYTVQREVKQSKKDNFASSVMFKTVVFKFYGTPACKQ